MDSSLKWVIIGILGFLGGGAALGYFWMKMMTDSAAEAYKGMAEDIREMQYEAAPIDTGVRRSAPSGDIQPDEYVP